MVDKEKKSNDFNGLKPGDKVQFRLAEEGQLIQGVIEHIDPDSVDVRITEGSSIIADPNYLTGFEKVQ